MKLPEIRELVVWGVKLLVVVAVIVGGYTFVKLNQKNITFAITHSSETANCRETWEKAVSNPLFQPVINQK